MADAVKFTFRAGSVQEVRYFTEVYNHHLAETDSSMSRNQLLNKLVEEEYHRTKVSDRRSKLEALVRAQADLIEMILYPEKASELRDRIGGRSIVDYLLDAESEGSNDG